MFSYDVSSIPNDKEELKELYESESVSGFHVKHFPMGHRATNYSKWFESESLYSIDYEEYFEPYVLCSKQQLKNIR